MCLVQQLLLCRGFGIASTTHTTCGFAIAWLVATEYGSNWAPNASATGTGARQSLRSKLRGHACGAVVAVQPKVGRGEVAESPILGSLPLQAADDRGGRGVDGQGQR